MVSLSGRSLQCAAFFPLWRKYGAMLELLGTLNWRRWPGACAVGRELECTARLWKIVYGSRPERTSQSLLCTRCSVAGSSSMVNSMNLLARRRLEQFGGFYCRVCSSLCALVFALVFAGWCVYSLTCFLFLASLSVVCRQANALFCTHCRLNYFWTVSELFPQFS